MKKVSALRVVTTAAEIESPLPAQVKEALGELVGAAREGLLALSVGVGLGVVHELMELEVTEVVGPKGEHNRERQALARRRYAQALDRRRHASSRAAVPTHHRLPRPRQARDRDRTPCPRRFTTEPRAARDPRARYRLTVNP
jgi:hypothetical protein